MALHVLLEGDEALRAAQLALLAELRGLYPAARTDLLHLPGTGHVLSLQEPRQEIGDGKLGFLFPDQPLFLRALLADVQLMHEVFLDLPDMDDGVFQPANLAFH